MFPSSRSTRKYILNFLFVAVLFLSLKDGHDYCCLGFSTPRTINACHIATAKTKTLLIQSRQGGKYDKTSSSAIHMNAPLNNNNNNKDDDDYDEDTSSSSSSQAEFVKVEVQENENNDEKIWNKKDDDADTETESNKSLKRLAQLSLEDYEWRSSVYKSKEADRRVEDYLAKMMGDEAAYVRPMDASEKKIGPLGLFEKSVVSWFAEVAEEEARRARQIVDLGGRNVRPKDLRPEDGDGELGPLGFLEQQIVDFLASIRRSEQERGRTRTLRPKDLDESARGPLGEAELRAVAAIRDILDSEKLRMEQTKAQGGRIVRPIDVPGPFGEFEMAVLAVVNAEKQRKMDGQQRRQDGEEIFLVRPMNSSIKGPLGELEEQAMETVKRLTEEEKERLRNFQKVLDENRPMERDRLSFLGLVEALFVGLLRAPILLFQIAMRVKELLESEYLDETDAQVLQRERERDQQKDQLESKKKDDDEEEKERP